VLLWHWETRSVIQVQWCCRSEYLQQAPERVQSQKYVVPFRETCRFLLKKCAGSPSVDPETVEMVREAFQRSLSNSGGQVPNSTFSFNNLVPVYNENIQWDSLWTKLFQTDGLGGADQSFGPLAPLI
jgi:hypothetical protein